MLGARGATLLCAPRGRALQSPAQMGREAHLLPEEREQRGPAYSRMTRVLPGGS